MRKILSLLTVILIGSLTLLPIAQAAESASTVVYDIVGTNPGGNGGYKGIVTIEATGQLLQVTWILSNGSKVTGTGIINDNTMSVAYPSGNTYGVCLYVRDPATEVVNGTWSIAGSSQLGTERWTPHQ